MVVPIRTTYWRYLQSQLEVICKKYVYQEEVGENGIRHLQGSIELLKKVDGQNLTFPNAYIGKKPVMIQQQMHTVKKLKPGLVKSGNTDSLQNSKSLARNNCIHGKKMSKKCASVNLIAERSIGSLIKMVTRAKPNLQNICM